MSHRPPPTLFECRDRLAALAGLGGWPALARWGRLLDLVALRRALPADAPLVTVVLGPTGAGKSTLFNAALGAPVSETGAIRPCTSRPRAVAPEEARGFVDADPFLGNPALGLTFRPPPPGADLGRQVLVDTPDFDSVADDHRRAADVLLLRADRVVLVFSPEKYADAAVWEVVEALSPLGNVTACLFNKSEGGEALADCRRLLAEAGLPAPLPVPRLARPDDPARWEPGLLERLAQVFRAPAEPGRLFAARRAGAESLEARLRAEGVAPWVGDLHGRLDRLAGELAWLADGLATRVEYGLPLPLSEVLGREIQQRFLEQVQRYDLLREPRRWLEAPFRALRQALPFLRSGAPAGEGTAGAAAQWLASAHQERYLELHQVLGEELRRLASEAGAGLEPRVAWPPLPDPAPAEAARSLVAAFAAVQERLRLESTRISEGLSTTGKLSFYGSQLLLNLLTLGALVGTGGGLSLGDLAAQGLVSPYVAKLAAHLVSSGEAAAVRGRLEAFLADRVVEELRPRLAPLERRVEELRAAVGTAEDWRAAAARWEREDGRAGRA
ncbi:MAG: GTPase [Deferrisomatales bacterium]